jgi:repressor LexA
MDNEMGKRIAQLREKRGWTKTFVAQKLGIKTMSTYANWEYGLRKPDPDMISKISSLFDVTTDYLINGSSVPINMTPINISEQAKVPLVGSIRAGIPIDRLENIEGYILVDPIIANGKDLFALRVMGESMSGDEIHDGDIVVVIKQKECDSSDIAVVAVDGDYATLKRVKYVGDTAMLIPSNPTMQPFIKKASEISIIGVVEEIRKKPRNRK